MREEVVARRNVLMAARVVLAMSASPPCETFSAIRGLETEGGWKPPPPLRDPEDIYGIQGASLK